MQAWLRLLVGAALAGSVVVACSDATAGGDDLAALLDHGRWVEAEAAARAHLAAVETSERPAGRATADALDLLARVLVVARFGQGAEARDLAERAVALRRQDPDGDLASLAGSLSNLGESLVGSGDLTAAEQALGQAMTIRSAVLGPDHPDVASSLVDLARLHRAQGRPDAAVALWREALASSRRGLGPGHPETCIALHGLGVSLYEAGRPAQARTVLEQALTLRVAALGEAHPLVADTLRGLAQVERHLGRIGRARAYAGRALAAYEARLGASHARTLDAVLTVANLARQQGDLTGARRMYERVLAAWEVSFGPDSAPVAGVLNNLALVYKEAGDQANAEKLLERSLAIRERSLGPDHPDVAQALTNLAAVLIEARRWSDAVPALRRAVAIRERAGGADSPALVPVLANLGEALSGVGAPAEAATVLERAVAISDERLGPGHPRSVEALINLGMVRLRAGDAAGAQALLERAASTVESALGPDHPRLAEVQGNLALALADQGDPDAALALALHAESVGRSHLELVMRALAEREALRYAASRPSGLDLAVTLAATRDVGPAAVAQVWDAVIRGRGQVLDEMAARRRALEEAGPEASAAAAEYREAASELSRLLVEVADAPTAGRREEVAQARRRLERAERTLAEASAAFRHDLDSTRPGLAEVLAALPPGSALLALVRFKPYLGPDGPQASDGGLPSYAAFAARAGEPTPRCVLLGPAAELDAAVARWRRGMSLAATTAKPVTRAAGEALRAKLWDPVAPLLGQAQRVFVVPDGQVHLVNLAGLPDGTGGWLVESGPLLHVLSHERDLLRPPAAALGPPTLLALGDPDFDAALGPAQGRATTPQDDADRGLRGLEPGCAGLGRVRFEPLPGTAGETAAIAGLWRTRDEADSARPSRDSVVTLTGAEASEQEFKALAPGARVLHLATHGFFLSGACDEGSARGRGIGGLVPATPAPTGAPAPPTNPLRLSGLVLAGANRRDQAGPGEDDGILTAEEIATTDLAGVEWAVLSACDTGVGEVDLHDGVLGLRRAFLIAGARTVITSLWSVRDEAAQEWMKALYQGRLERGLDTAEAVRQASLTLLHGGGESADPSSWAAFLAVGDWR